MSTLEHLTTAQVARLLGRDVRTVRRLIESGELVPAHKLPGLTGAYLFDPRDVEAFRRKRRAS